MLKCSIACIWPRGRGVTGSSHVCHHCIICHVLITYIDSFLQRNIRSDNFLQRQSRDSVVMTKGTDKGSGKGGWVEGEGCEREGRGFETLQLQFFSSFFSSFFTYYPQKIKALFLSTPNLIKDTWEYKNAFYSRRQILKGAPKHLIQS